MNVEGVELPDISGLNLHQQIKKLMEHKDTLDTQLSWNLSELAKTPAGMNEPLIDSEGFPRADCDLHLVRKLRNRVICLRTDLKVVTSEIEKKLYLAHENSSTTKTPEQKEHINEDNSKMTDPANNNNSNNDNNNTEQQNDHTDTTQGESATDLNKRYAEYKSFLKVGSVLEDSPAEEAKLQVNDEIISWNGITYQHQQPMTMIAQITGRYENKTMSVVVRRQDSLIALSLTPKKWSGKGLLGCSLNKM